MRSVDSIVGKLSNRIFSLGKFPINGLTILVSLFFVLIPLLAFYQYQWLGKLSEGEKERLKSTLKYASHQFVKDFDDQLSSLYTHFETHSENQSSTTEEIARHIETSLSQFRQESDFPALIVSVALLSFDEKADGYAYYIYDESDSKLLASQWPSYLSGVKKSIKPENDASGAVRFNIIQGLQFDETPYFMIPVFRNQGSIFSVNNKVKITPKYLVIRLNYDVLKSQIVPALVSSYFSTENELNYNLTIFSRKRNQILFNSDSSVADLSGLVFDNEATIGNLRTSNFLFNQISEIPDSQFSKSELKTKLKLSNSSTGSSYSYSTSTTDDLPVTIVNKRPAEILKGKVSPATVNGNVMISTMIGRTSNTQILNNSSVQIFSFVNNEMSINHSQSEWLLGIRHLEGSLDDAVSNARLKNMIISFTILSLLGFTLLIMLIAIGRSQKLASQQMEFVATVSHELRTPLAVIRSAAENLTDGVVTNAEQFQKYGHLILNNGRRLSDMVEQVLEFSGIQSHNKKYNFQLTESVAFFNEFIAEFRQNNSESDLTIESNISNTLPAVEIDRLAIRSVCVNLLQNSIKYSVAPKHIIFTVSSVSNSILISVKDFGIGIDEKDLNNLFEPFYRGRNATEAQIKGTGLGLSLVQSIVKEHSGSVHVKSKLNSGTEFMITIPLKRKI